MEQLLLDLNSRDYRGWVRIGPAAAVRLAALREHRVRVGDQVEVLDAEGNRCIGTLRQDPTLPRGHRWLVELDWSTWTDGEAEVDDRHPQPATTVASQPTSASHPQRSIAAAPRWSNG